MKAKIFNTITDVILWIGLMGLFGTIFIMIFKFLIISDNSNQQHTILEIIPYLKIISISIIISIIGCVKRNY